MSLTQNRAKVIPNRLVLKHEEFLINKSLSTKIHNVKSTINSNNKTFERVILTRQKRDSLPPTLHKTRSIEDPAAFENQPRAHTGIPSTQTHEFRIKTTDAFSGRFPRDFVLSPQFQNRKEGFSSGARIGTGGTFGSPRGPHERLPITKYSVQHPPISHANALLGSRDRSSVHHESGIKKNQEVEVLKDQLIEKDLELKQLKSELKDWWHEDFKTSQPNLSKENLTNPHAEHDQGSLMASPEKMREQGASNNRSSMKNGNNSSKSTGVSFSLKADSEKKVLLPQEMQKNSIQYHNSLKILEKIEETAKSKKKLEPLNRSQSKKGDENKDQEDENRPSSTRNKKPSSSEKFRLRFSNQLEQGMLKINTRYQPNEVEVIEEIVEPEKEEQQEASLEKEGIKKPIMFVPKPRPSKNRYQTESEEEEEIEEEIEKVDEAESPLIVTTSKHLMLQPRSVSFKSIQDQAIRTGEFF